MNTKNLPFAEICLAVAMVSRQALEHLTSVSFDGVKLPLIGFVLAAAAVVLGVKALRSFRVVKVASASKTLPWISFGLVGFSIAKVLFFALATPVAVTVALF